MVLPDKKVTRSLLLPLREEERAIYSSFLSLFAAPPGIATEDEHDHNHLLAEELFSPVTGSCHDERQDARRGEDVEGNSTTRSRTVSSALLSLISAPADYTVTVLQDRQVVFHDFRNPDGPVELRRFSPMQSTREAKQRKFDVPIEATCVSLIDMEISYACRIASFTRDIPSDEARGAPQSAISEKKSTATIHHNERSSAYTYPGTMPTFLRGVVGSNDGRINVFSEHGYCFGFAAHDSPVTACHVTYTTGDSEKTDGDSATHRRCFQEATERLGFVTAGSDGAIWVWRRRELNLKPIVVMKPSILTRHVAFCVYQPSSLGWLVSDASPSPLGLLSSSQLIYSASSCRHEVITRSLRTLNEPITDTVCLPGGLMSHTTAVARDDATFLVARGRRLFSVSLSTRDTTRVLTTQSDITHLALQANLVVVCCGERGNVYMLVRQSDVWTLMGEYHSIAGQRVRSITAHQSNLAICLVTADGAVEVVGLPEVYREAAGVCGPAVMCLPAARALSEQAAVECGTSESMSERDHVTSRSADGHCESMLLAQMAVPQQCGVYVNPTALPAA